MNEITKIRTILEAGFYPEYVIYSGLVDEKQENAISFLPNVAGEEDKTAGAIPFYSPSYSLFIQGNGLHSESYAKARNIFNYLRRFKDEECFISAITPITFDGMTEAGIQVFTFEITFYNIERG